MEGMGLTMKRLLGWMLALMMLLAMNFACAEEFPYGEFVRIEDGDEIVLWSDTLTVKFELDSPDGGNAEYTFQINDGEPMVDSIYTTEGAQLQAMRGNSSTFFFIGGPSDSGDSIYHVYEYVDDALYRMPGKFVCDYSTRELRATKYDSFFANVYDVTALGGFVHEQEFVIASNGNEMSWNDYAPYMCGVFALPNGLYPYGRIVEIAQDLPLLSSREDGAETVTLNTGDYAVIVGCDGEQWAYISEITEEENCELRAGWLKLIPGSYEHILVDGQEVYASEHINGIVIGG